MYPQDFSYSLLCGEAKVLQEYFYDHIRAILPSRIAYIRKDDVRVGMLFKIGYIEVGQSIFADYEYILSETDIITQSTLIGRISPQTAIWCPNVAELVDYCAAKTGETSGEILHELGEYVGQYMETTDPDIWRESSNKFVALNYVMDRVEGVAFDEFEWKPKVNSE